MWSPAVPQCGTRGGQAVLTLGLPVVPTSVSRAALCAPCMGSKKPASSSLLAGATLSLSPGLHTTAFGAGGGGILGRMEDIGHAPSHRVGLGRRKKKPKLFTEAAGFVPTEGVQC